MYEIDMVGENILAQKVEAENKTQFANPGDGDRQGAIYRICHGTEEYKPGELVLLKPGSYSSLHFEDELYTTIEEADIIGKVREVQK